ncbi:MAG: hypothetical protein GY832_31120 [Chloroflexi bacterium]|nr:hypothetical protein [Chloroflexota bacterium]
MNTIASKRILNGLCLSFIVALGVSAGAWLSPIRALSGGPDAFGYMFTDSTETGGPDYHFDDISGTGSPISLDNDQMSGAIPIGFAFTYYGVDHTHVAISSNGFITVLSGQSPACCNGQPLPQTDAQNGVIAGWWEDLDPSEYGGTIHYETLGSAPNRRFIVQFENVQHYLSSSTTAVTFQFKLFEGTDEIEIHYQDAFSDGGVHSAGIEDQSGTIGLQYHLGDASLSPPHLAVRYYLPDDVYLAPPMQTRGGWPGTTVTYTGTVWNLTGMADSFGLMVSDNVWPTTLSASNTGIIADDSSFDFAVYVDVPSGSLGSSDTITVVATSDNSAAYSDASILTTIASQLGYVLDHSDGQIRIVDTVNHADTGTSMGASRPLRGAISPDGRWLYASLPRVNQVLVVDAGSNTVLTTIAVGIQPHGIAFSADGAYAFVANRSSDSVWVIDTSVPAVISTLPVGLEPVDVASNPFLNQVYVTNRSNATVSVIDVATLTVSDTIGGLNYPRDIAISPDGLRAYVSNQGAEMYPGDGSIGVIDTATGNLFATWSISSTWLMGLDVSPDGGTLYVVDAYAGDVHIVDTSTGLVIATIATSSHMPWDVEVFPAWAGPFAYVSNSRWTGTTNTPNIIDVIDINLNTVTETIPLGNDLRGLALFPMETVDYGDAPDPTYPTLLANNGARHIIAPGFFLGGGIDADVDGQPDATATGDDLLDGNDDEDGVTFVSLLNLGQSATVDVVASSPGFLNAWIDWNSDGDWVDADDQIVSSHPLVAGSNGISFSVPLEAVPGSAYARFRFSSEDSVTYDGLALDGEVEDYVAVVNGPPVAIDDANTTDEDTPLNVGSPGVLDNDSDPNMGDTLFVVAFDALTPQGAIANVNDGGDYGYDPNSQFEYLAVGEWVTDQFGYTVGDSGGLTDTATVVITVTGVNDAPRVVNDGFTVAEYSVDNTLDVLFNDTDPDNSDTLAIHDISIPDHGGTALTDGAVVTYTPDFGFFGTETFTYTAGDGNGGLAQASVVITVATAHLPPVADAGVSQIITVGTFATLDGSGSTDPDGDWPLTYGWMQVSGIAVTLSDRTAVSPTFTAPITSALLTFALVVTDAHGLHSRPDTVTVTIEVPVVSPSYVYLPVIVRNYPPLPEVGSVTIAGGSDCVYRVDVTLAMSDTFASGADTVDWMRLSNESVAWDENDWEPFGPTKAWQLASGTSGLRTVYTQFKGSQGGVSNPPASDAVYVALNGDFEYGALTPGWQSKVNPLPVSIEQSVQERSGGSTPPADGDNVVLLGGLDYLCEFGGMPIGYASIEQTFDLPPNVDSQLTFRYIIWSQDTSIPGDYDRFEVYVDGDRVFSDGNQVNEGLNCDQWWRVPGVDNPRSGQTDGWATAEVDLSDYAGQSVVIAFRNSNRYDSWYNTYTYVDSVTIEPISEWP